MFGGLQSFDLLQSFSALCGLTHLDERSPQPVIRFNPPGQQLNSPAEQRHRFGRPFQLTVCFAERENGFAVCGIKLQSFGKMLRRLVRMALAELDISQKKVGWGKTRI